MRVVERNEGGFTLTELLVVVLVLGLLVSLVVATYFYAQNRAMVVAEESSLRTLRGAVERYKANHGGALPGQLRDLYPDLIKNDAGFKCVRSGADFSYNPATGEVWCDAHPEL